MASKLFIASSTATTDQRVRGRVVHSKWAHAILTFLMVFGPGLIVMEADNDAGAVSTYVQAGAQYGTHLLLDFASSLAGHVLHSGNGRAFGNCDG